MIPSNVVMLCEQECLELLSQPSVGRIGASVGALPVVLPVNFALVGGSICFRADERSELAHATADAIVAFEVDAYDRDSGTGWSVLVQGKTSEVTNPATISEVVEAIPNPLGTRADATRVVEISIATLSGCRIERPRQSPT